MSKHVCLLFALALASCPRPRFVPEPDDPSAGCVDLNEATTRGCPGGTCGGNSPYVNAFPIIGVSPGGCKNSEGVSLVPTETTADGVSFASQRCQPATRLGIRDNPQGHGWELIGRDDEGRAIGECSGVELVGTEFSFVRDGLSDVGTREHYAARVKIMRAGLVRARRGRSVIGYVFVDPNPIVAKESPSGHVDDSVEDDSASSQRDVIVVPVPVLPPVAKAEWPSLCSAMESQKLRGQLRLASGWRYTGATASPRPTIGPLGGPLTELDGEEAGDAVVILRGEIYDGAATVMEGKGGEISEGWYNFACAKDGLGKIALERGAVFDGNLAGVARRQTLLHMESALYCKAKSAKRSVRGYSTRGIRVEARWRGDGYSGANPVEARWGRAGATCIDYPRVLSSNRVVPKDVLPEGCLQRDCTDKNAFLEELNAECGLSGDQRIGQCEPEMGPAATLESRVADVPFALPRRE